MKKVMGNNQHGFTEGKLCLIAFYDRITGFTDAGRARGIIYFDLEKLLIYLPQHSCIGTRMILSE